MRNDVDPDETLLLHQLQQQGVGAEHPTQATVRPAELPPDEPQGRRLSDEELPVLVGPGKGEESDPIVLGELLGKGAAGFVQSARQTSLERDVAVKRIRKRPPPQREVDALLSEARVTGALEHPNIIPVYALGRAAAGEPLLVMKKVAGTTWKDLIRDPGHENWSTWRGDPLDRHLAIVIQVCRALEFAHDRGYLHLDIKPHNVMVGRFGETWVMDWGLATRLDSLPSLPDREIVGTPAYMAPELLKGRRHARIQSDVFLLGAVLYEVLTGQALYRGESLSRVLMAALQCVPPTFPGDVPTPLADIVRKACAREIEARFPNARALREAVEDYQARRGAMALSLAAQRQADEVRQLLPDPEQRPSPEIADRVSALATSSRFGFEQSLLQWPANPEARDGLQSLLDHTIRFELARNNLDAVGPMLAALPVPRPRLEERLREARAVLGEQLEARDRLAELRAQGMFAAGGWSRSIGMLVNGTAWAVILLAWGRAIDSGAIVNPERFNLWVCVVASAVSIATVFLLRRLFLDNTARRAFTAAYMVFIVGLDLNRVASTFLDIPLRHTFTADHAGLLMFIGALSAFVSPTLWWATGVAAVSMVVTALWPSAMFPVAGLGLFLINAIIGWALRPPSAGGKFA